MWSSISRTSSGTGLGLAIVQGLVTKMNNPDPELVANYPLQDGYVKVQSIPENPGYYRVDMAVMPHFQIEGGDARLSLVSQLPAGKDG